MEYDEGEVKLEPKYDPDHRYNRPHEHIHPYVPPSIGGTGGGYGSIFDLLRGVRGRGRRSARVVGASLYKLMRDR